MNEKGMGYFNFRCQTLLAKKNGGYIKSAINQIA